MADILKFKISEMLSRILAAQGKKFIHQMRECEQRRPYIKAITFLGIFVEFAAYGSIFFQECDGKTQVGQTYGSGEAGDASADNDDVSLSLW